LTCASLNVHHEGVTGNGGLWDCETSRIAHLLDKRVTDCGEIVNHTRRPNFTKKFQIKVSYLKRLGVYVIL
jgi:hypothetical protein